MKTNIFGYIIDGILSYITLYLKPNFARYK